MISKKQDPRYIEIVILAISKNTSLNDKTGEDPRYLENCYSRSGYLVRKPRQMTSNIAMEIHHFDWSKFIVYISDQKIALSKQTPLRQYLAEVN